MSLLNTSRELFIELTSQLPDNTKVKSLIEQLHCEVFGDIGYVSHLLDLASDNYKLSDRLREWYLTWCRQDRNFKDLRVRNNEGNLEYVKPITDYSVFNEVPRLYNDHFDEYVYDSITNYIRLNCDPNDIDKEWLRQPYLI